MTMRDQIKALQAENDALRAEVAGLRAHVCLPAQPACTCNGTMTAGLIGCPAHGWYRAGGGSWIGAAPGAADTGWRTITVNANQLPVTMMNPAANACAGPATTYWVTT